MKYVIKLTLTSERNPVSVVSSAIEPLLRKNESVEVSSVNNNCGTHSVTVDLKLHKAVYHPSDWVTEAVETSLLEGENATDWDYEQIKPEDV